MDVKCRICRQSRCKFLISALFGLLILFIIIGARSCFSPTYKDIRVVSNQNVSAKEEIQLLQNHINQIIHYYENFINIQISLIAVILGIAFLYGMRVSKIDIENTILDRLSDPIFVNEKIKKH